MYRALILTLLLCLCLSAQPQRRRDPYFTRYPFERWLHEPETAGIKWNPHITRARLTVHQRLATRIEILLDAREVAKRRGRGELVTLVQIEDAAGHQWRIHNASDLARIPPDAKPYPLQYAQEVFLTPGDYKFTLATCDSDSPDHSFTVRHLHVPEVRNDPIPQIGRGLPAVEFPLSLEAPDVWYQPTVRGRLRIPLATAHPMHLEILVNMTPSDRGSGPLRAFRRNMALLIPSLKVLAGLEVPAENLSVELLDLTRQKIYLANGPRGLDWAKLRPPLADNQPGVIDAQSLAVKSQMLQFLRDRVVAKAAGPIQPDDLHVILVLSAPAFFNSQLRLDPAILERDPHRRIFYLRYRPIPRPGPDGVPPSLPPTISNPSSNPSTPAS